eukprot:2840949-Rhodomonas_salina.1
MTPRTSVWPSGDRRRCRSCFIRGQTLSLDKQHVILLDMNEGRPPEKFASAEASFFKIITELLQTSKVCEIKASVEGAEEGRNRQLADFAMVFNQAQEHMRNHAEVMGCGEVMYRQNMCMLVGLRSARQWTPST